MENNNPEMAATEITVADLLANLNRHFPLQRAESWDKVGLQIGSAASPVKKVLLAHEITDAVLDATENQEYDALVVYHPLIFSALKNLDFASHTARLSARCISAGINVIALHTALDNAPLPTALGDYLARQLELEDVKVLFPSNHETWNKIIVFVPLDALEKVQNAVWEAGAGHIGNYDQASFRARGTGTFRPLEGSNPHSGKQGKLEQANEWRLEVLVTQENRDAVIEAMLKAHPYEEVAYDVVQLENYSDKSTFGPARIGKLSQEMTLNELAHQVQMQLQPPGIRIVYGAKDMIQTVACVPGSGASFIEKAARLGCDCLVTGDIKHHDALQAQALGLSLIDVTHAATESAAVSMIESTFTEISDIEVYVFEQSTNPFHDINP